MVNDKQGSNPIRDKVRELKKSAEIALSEDGSSNIALSEFAKRCFEVCGGKQYVISKILQLLTRY